MKTKIIMMMYPDKVSTKKLYNYCIDNHIQNNKDYNGDIIKGMFDFHLTLFAREFGGKDIDIMKDSHIDLYANINTSPQELLFLGEDNNIPCIKVKSSYLNVFRKQALKTFNIIQTFKSFIPHVSLTYNGFKNIDTLPLPNFQIKFNRFIIKDFVE